MNLFKNKNDDIPPTEDGQPAEIGDTGGSSEELSKEKAIQEHTTLAAGYDILLEEKRQKKRRAIVISTICVLTVTTVVFVALYILNFHRKEEICGQRYLETLERLEILLDKCLDDDFDYETKFREINSELGNARGMLFEAESTQAEQTTITDLYYLAIKLPDQFRLYMSDIRNALNYIISGNDDKGYALIDQVVSKSDKLDYGYADDSSEQVETDRQ